MAEDARAVASEMPVKGNALRTSHKSSPSLALRNSIAVEAQVPAIELDEIECAQQCIMIAKPLAQGIEYREAALVNYDDLAVERA